MNQKISSSIDIKAKLEYDLLEPPIIKRIKVKRAESSDLEVACRISNNEIPGGVSTAPLVRDVIALNRDNAFVFWHRETIVGIYAMLMLRPLGLERLLLGELDCTNPDPACLIQTGETPAAIYKWAMVAPGLAAEGILHMSKILRQPKFRKANFFSRPNTPAGIRINLNRGFRPVTCQTPGLYRYVRLENRFSELPCAA